MTSRQSTTYHIGLLDYRCQAEGTKNIELDRTEIFTKLRFGPEITVRTARSRDSDATATDKRVRKALVAVQMYSLVANSVKSAIMIEPVTTVTEGTSGDK